MATAGDRKEYAEIHWANIRRNLDSITATLREKYSPLAYHPNAFFLMETEKSRSSFADALDFLMEAACSVMEGKGNGFGFHVVDRKDWENVVYDPSVGLLLKDDPRTTNVSSKRIGAFLALMLRIRHILRSNIFQTKRKLYYVDKDLFGKSQCKLDTLIEDLAASLQLPRISLHILSTSKGLFCGKFKLTTTTIEEDSGLFKILPIEIDNVVGLITEPAYYVDIESEAKFCLVVEKEAVFNDLVHGQVHRKFNCILVTGKGVPDLPTRRFVHLIWHFLRIPIFCLADGDPRGLEIMCIYRFGALSSAYDNQNLAVPQMKWLGILPTDLLDDRYKGAFECIDTEYMHNEAKDEEVTWEKPEGNPWIDREMRQKAFTMGLEDLTARDVERLLSLKNRPYIEKNEELKKQIYVMLSINVKAGLELLSEVAHDYIWDWYLPMKLEDGNFL